MNIQVSLENPSSPGKYTVILPPVCSKPIFDAKAKKELQIMDMSDNTAPAEGGKKIIILCEKVSKEDIKVRFFNYNGWEEWADLGPAGVHKQHAISLTAPRYSDPGITEAVRVGVELVKPSDDSRSEEEEFFYLPSSRPGPALLTEGSNLGLSSYTFEYNIPVTQGAGSLGCSSTAWASRPTARPSPPTPTCPSPARTPAASQTSTLLAAAPWPSRPM